MRPSLDWKDSTYPYGTIFDYYQLQVATDSGFLSIILDVSLHGLNNSEYTFHSDLSPNTKYYWRARAFNTAGHYSGWSTLRYFREAIATPQLLSPAHEAAPVHLCPSFDWHDVQGADNYTIQISRNSSMKWPFVNNKVTTSGYTPAKDLPANTTLYWRVKANGENGPSAWSQVRSLDTPNAPSRPKLLYPSYNGLVLDLRPRLDWKNSTLPVGTTFDRYELQAATDRDFNVVIRDVNIYGLTNSEYSFPTNLSPNTKYSGACALSTHSGITATGLLCFHLEKRSCRPNCNLQEMGRIPVPI